ncbi:MAG: helix-turn-helix transcriptional regulator [Prevotellaceae bacterium]|jgi:transcriptional regulator with XRE-family HTH domain|nr:helix-turn-helix transcriptional regulator [Prevotellaceae bacterium]
MDGVDRIQQVISSAGMTQTEFAREIGVSGPTISQLVSRARNQQPSLDVIKKIVARFTDISLEWLVLGSGSMRKDTAQSRSASLFEPPRENAPKTATYGENTGREKQIDKPQTWQTYEAEIAQKLPKTEPRETAATTVEKEIKEVAIAKQITKIILYFSDSTFQEFFP